MKLYQYIGSLTSHSLNAGAFTLNTGQIFNLAGMEELIRFVSSLSANDFIPLVLPNNGQLYQFNGKKINQTYTINPIAAEFTSFVFHPWPASFNLDVAGTATPTANAVNYTNTSYKVASTDQWVNNVLPQLLKAVPTVHANDFYVIPAPLANSIVAGTSATPVYYAFSGPKVILNFDHISTETLVKIPTNVTTTVRFDINTSPLATYTQDQIDQLVRGITYLTADDFKNMTTPIAISEFDHPIANDFSVITPNASFNWAIFVLFNGKYYPINGDVTGNAVAPVIAVFADVATKYGDNLLAAIGSKQVVLDATSILDPETGNFSDSAQPTAPSNLAGGKKLGKNFLKS